MTNRITEDVIMGAAASGKGAVLSVGKFINFCVSDDFAENVDFLKSRGCDIDALRTSLKAHLKQEEIDLSSLDQFSRMLGAGGGMMTPDFRKLMDASKEMAKKSERDIYFEDFLNALFKLAASTNKVITYLVAAGYQHNPNTGIMARGKYKALYELCDDLNEKARNKRIDPLIGRKDEVQRMVEVLAHYKKKNPLLVGPPGVGKTAVAEGLASAIEQGMVPDALKNVKIFSLQVAAVLAGTKFRGDFEERMRNVIKDIQKMKEKDKIDVILFIDEMHQIIGAGASGQGQGATDMSNILKPGLADGSLSVIGATTDDEFKLHIQKDKALTRRFQMVKIEEPSKIETLRILEQGIKPVLEKYHGVKYPTAVLERAVDLSAQYLTQQFFPDKAISLIDSVGAKLRTSAVTRKTANITDVEEIVSKITGTPVSAFKKKTGKNGYVDIAKLIKKEVFGQDEQIDKIVEIVELARAGLQDEGQPIGSFLLLGPTGTGKTEVAKQIAKHTDSHFFKINMGEYGEEHSPAKLFGAPPGYEGHKEGGILTNEITRYPHTVLLLDEVEKAHKKVYEALLGIIDGASMTDGEGNKVLFNNVLILMTSNAGAAIAAKTKRPLGLSSELEKLEQQAKTVVSSEVINSTFSPEFRNKLSGMVHFNSLDKSIIDKITDKFIGESANKLFLKKNITLNVSKEVRDMISEKGFDPAMGARPIARMVKETIDKVLVKPILKGEIKELDTVNFKLDNGEVKFEVVSPAPIEPPKEEVAATEDIQT
jgi:ATP-dependent Clp protease ATP-binding subunit ClpA